MYVSVRQSFKALQITKIVTVVGPDFIIVYLFFSSWSKQKPELNMNIYSIYQFINRLSVVVVLVVFA